jgi:hypothetical protein
MEVEEEGKEEGREGEDRRLFDIRKRRGGLRGRQGRRRNDGGIIHRRQFLGREEQRLIMHTPNHRTGKIVSGDIIIISFLFRSFSFSFLFLFFF